LSGEGIETATRGKGGTSGSQRRPESGYCAGGRSSETEQESRDARKKKGDELIQGLFCNFREKQGLN
jgi:hypothetical protein